MTTYSVLLAGRIEPTPRLRALVAGTRTIAADRGIEHALPLGLEPDLWVGDFDSARGDFPGVSREEHPARKDVSDGELAVAAARKRGATRLVVVGPFGGRTDHATLHLLLAFRWHAEGLAPILSDGREEAWVVDEDGAAPDWPQGTTFSVLAFDDVRVSLRGCDWPLDGAAVRTGSTLTLSNVSRDGLEARVEGGRALLVAQVGGAQENE